VILENGVVRTMDPSLPTAAALAIAGERVVGGVGTHESALPTPDRVDLRGRCVLPAFTDSHVHFPTWSLARSDVQLEGSGSLSEALARVSAHRPRGEWLRGHGWRDAGWSEHPSRQVLDEVTGDRPAALWSKDYHSLWLNTAALARAGGDLEVHGGVVERDADREPTGVLREESAWRFRERHVTVTEDEWVTATRDGLRVANERGVGAIHDKDGWLGAHGIFGRIHETGGLTLRVWQSLPAEHVGRLGELGLRARVGDDYLRLGYLKTFMDGTLGSQTAWMLDGSGVCITSGEELAELGVACSVQFSHAPSDRDLAERFWGDRLDGTYAFGTLLRSGAVVANGSDAPVEELDPLAGIAAGVLRTIDERPAWRPEEAVTVEEALHATTVTPAWLAGDERRRGKLLPGFLADLVVLDRDPAAIPAEELPELRVVATMVGGRWVHNPPPWD
jgi:predicted amidohydrolase YtcJ